MLGYTKQHKSVWETLQRDGRYVGKRKFVELELEEHAGIMMRVYDFLVQYSPNRQFKPADADYPIWFVVNPADVMLKEPDRLHLTFEVPEEKAAYINIAKWGAIMNYSYLPKDEADRQAHRDLLTAYGISDAEAVMTPFYPQIKRKIEASWQRLFDEDVRLGNDSAYGIIWELRKDWIVDVTE